MLTARLPAPDVRPSPAARQRPASGWLMPLAWWLLASLCGLAFTAQAAEPLAAPAGPVERQYLQTGPWAVVLRANAGCCDSAGFGYAVWAPRELGRGGVLHPVITWGNGTGAPPEAYEHLLRHWASWGFVVVASRQPMAGSGQEMRDALQWLLTQNERPASPFYHRLATDRVASVGHSQGAVGALNALKDSGGAIRTAIAVAIPAQSFCPAMGWCADPALLASGSVMYVNGTRDLNVSPSFQPRGAAGLQSNQAYYAATPTSRPKAWGSLLGVGHSDLMGQPACNGTDPDCLTGVWGFLGYPTAWLMDQLQGDAAAHAAFTPGSGEFFVTGGHWRNQASQQPPAR